MLGGERGQNKVRKESNVGGRGRGGVEKKICYQGTGL